MNVTDPLFVSDLRSTILFLFIDYCFLQTSQFFPTVKMGP